MSLAAEALHRHISETIKGLVNSAPPGVVVAVFYRPEGCDPAPPLQAPPTARVKVAEAAGRLGCSVQTVYKLMLEGHLECVWVGRLKFTTEGSLSAYERSHHRPAKTG